MTIIKGSIVVGIVSVGGCGGGGGGGVDVVVHCGQSGVIISSRERG